MNKINSIVSLFVILAGVMLMLGACTGQEGPESSDNHKVDVSVIFDSEGCPESVDPNSPLLDQKKGTRIVWTARDKQGNPIGVAFGVYYNPFVGKSSNRETKNGVLRSPPVNTAAASASHGETVYKYTILADACPDKPLDPNIRVQR